MTPQQFDTMTPQQFDNSLEALASLLYLVRCSLDRPAKATTYFGLAEQVLADIVAKQSLNTPSNVQLDRVAGGQREVLR
jgi:hypothetical protein